MKKFVESCVLRAVVGVCCSKRCSLILKPSATQGNPMYNNEPAMEAGQNKKMKNTEFYDGYTDDFGVYKEGPPTVLRLEYVRSPDHGDVMRVHEKMPWSPFQVGNNMMAYTPFWYDWQSQSSRDYWGHRSGSIPGLGPTQRNGHYNRKDLRRHDTRFMVNHHQQKRVPKWLACIVNDQRKKQFVGFFLYANGAYCCELLTYKQLPRLVYNRPFQGCIPTIGQTVSLSETTYGKELSDVEMYPGLGGACCRAAGTAGIVLRGSEPSLVPVLLPSKEIRLFEPTCHATFGRRAGVMQNRRRLQHAATAHKLQPHRPFIYHFSKSVSQHPEGGGSGPGTPRPLRLNWRLHPWNQAKSKYWLCGYVVRGRQYNKGKNVADLKAKTYGWASRDPVTRF